MQGFKEVELQEIFDFPSIRGLTALDGHTNTGNIPIYGGRKTETPIHYIADNIEGVKYFENCLGWNRNGSAGYVFWHKTKFAVSDDHRPMILKPSFSHYCDLNYLRHEIQLSLLNAGFSWGQKAGKEAVQTVFIKIPIDKNGEFDLEKQKEIAKRHALVEKIQNRLDEAYKTFKNVNVVVDSISSDTKDFFVEEIFNVFKTKKNSVKSKVETIEYSVPVYSAQSTNYGIVGYTDIADFQASDHDTLITFGDHTRKFFIRNKCFSITDNVKVLQLKAEFKPSIDIEYFIYTASKLIPNIGYARHWNEAKSTAIPIPVNHNNELDVNIQKQIAAKYKEIEKIQNYLTDNLKILKSCNVAIGCT